MGIKVKGIYYNLLLATKHTENPKEYGLLYLQTKIRKGYTVLYVKKIHASLWKMWDLIAITIIQSGADKVRQQKTHNPLH